MAHVFILHTLVHEMQVHCHNYTCSMFMKLTFDPDSLRNEVSQLRNDLTAMMERVDATSITGFLTAYGFLCDFFGVEYNREVSWVSGCSVLVSVGTVSW